MTRADHSFGSRTSLDATGVAGQTDRWRVHATLLSVVLAQVIAGLPCAGPAVAQNPETERRNAERFLQVLVRRPRPGTALDRVYGYHVQAGSLGNLIDTLEKQADELTGEEAGARQMLIGLLRLQRGDDAAAAKAFAEAEDLRPEDAMASYHLGKALLLVGRNDDAAEALQRSIDREPSRLEALPVFTELGRLYQRAQQTEKALRVWDQLEKRFPGDQRISEQIARTLADEGQHAAALQRYEKLAEASISSADPRGIDFRIAAAELKRELGRADEAIADLETIQQRLRPSSWLYSDVRRRIEAGFLRTGDYAGLADYYTEQVQSRRDEIPLRLRLAKTLAKAGRLNEAEQSLRETIQLAPDDEDARLTLIDLLKTTGELQQAAEQLEALVKQHPENPDYLVQLGSVWLDVASLDQQRRRAKAAAAWERLAEARAEDPVVIAQVADLLRGIEQKNEAIRLYRRAIELAPEQPQYREYLGEYLHRLDRGDEALRVWKQIAAGDRATRENLIRLAEVFNTFDYPDKALDAFAEAAKLDPTFSQRLRYAELLSQAERYDQALQQLDLAASLGETPEQRERVLRVRIDVYGSSGTLDARIADARSKAEESNRSDDYRSLALMLDAATRLPEAIDAIRKSLDLDGADVSALAIAAELYRKSNRLGEAIEIYRQLSELDQRFLPNYLKRISGLQMRLGQSDKALATADELIEAQPGSPDPYRFYARQCFQLGRANQGIEALRRALRVAPRDTDTQHALASALADDFRTDEAIEIYWQLIDGADELDERSGLVSKLAQLYDRKGDFDRLLNRLELRGREESDTRSAVLLTAAAYRAIEDLGSARQVLTPLLAENPRDAELLDELVNLCVLANDAAEAVNHQKRLIELADTRENRNKLLTLLVDSGQIERAEASLQRLRGVDDPATMIRMIDRSVRRGNHEAAIRFCRTVLSEHQNLWEVRIKLAVLLLMDDEIDAALEQADRVDQMDLAWDVPSESAKAKQNQQQRRTSTGETSTAERQAYVRLYPSVRGYHLARVLRLGQYSSSAYSNSSSSAPITLNQFSDAEACVVGIRLAAAALQDRFDKALEKLLATIDLENSDDPDELLTAYHALSTAQYFDAPTPQLPGEVSKYAAQMERLSWRMAEIDASTRDRLVYSQLSRRYRIRNPPPYSNQAPATTQPLTQKQLEIAELAAKAPSTTSNTRNTLMTVFLHDELLASGMKDRASAMAAPFKEAVGDAAVTADAIRFLSYVQDSQALTDQLQHLQQRLPDWAAAISDKDRGALSGSVDAVVGREDIDPEVRRDAVNLRIALQAVASVRSQRPRRRSQASGTTNVTLVVNGNYTRDQIVVPFADSLLDPSFASQLYAGLKLHEASPESRDLLDEIARNQPVFDEGSEFGIQERKLKSVLTAFASWWLDDAEGAFADIVKISNRYPEDNELWIERARLAAELERPEASLEALDAIDPLDQATLRVRELAAMNLAGQLGKLERAKEAARRLFGMRLDKQTELVLSDQLTRLGMHDMATAVLQRSRRRGGQSVNELLNLAQKFVSTGNHEAASEVAYDALRQLNSGNESNASYYRRRAVDLLKQAGRLDGLLRQAERRVKTAPNSLSLKTELAELYTAAGRKQDADKLFEDIAELQPNDPKMLWRTAEQLSAVDKHDEAVGKFLLAIKEDPQLLRQDYYTFQRAFQSCNIKSKVFASLLELNLKQVDSYSLQRMANLPRYADGDAKESAKEFTNHLLAAAPTEALGGILRYLSRQDIENNGDAIRDVSNRIFSDDGIYYPNHSFWRSVSRSTGGQVNGSLELLFGGIAADEKKKREFREQLVKKTGEETAEGIATALLLGFDVTTGRTEGIDQRVQQALTMDHAKVPHYLWWEVGQLFEKQDPLQETAVQIFEYVRDDPDSSANDEFPYGIGAKLATAYADAGQEQKARELLLNAYESFDTSDYDRYNPGYGDYQFLRGAEAIGQQLEELGYLLDAFRIVSEVLAKPQCFQAAKRYAGSRYSPQHFETQLQELTDSLTDDEFKKFLTRKQDKDTALAFDLLPAQPTAGIKAWESSIAARVVASLAESEDGRKALRIFDEQAAEQEKQRPADWSLRAMRLLVALANESPAAGDRLDALHEALPEFDEEDLPATEGRQSVLALYSPAIVALQSNEKAAYAGAVDLADYLIKVAQQAERSDFASVLTVARLTAPSRTQDASRVAAEMRKLLDATLPDSEPQKVINAELAQEVFRIAESAARTGAWDVAMEALRRSLGAGPPLRTVDSGQQSAKSAFAIATSSGPTYSSTSASESQDLDWIPQKVAELINERKDASQAESEQAYRALTAAVLPDSRPTETFPYLTDQLESTNYNSGFEPEMQPVSLSRQLVDAAIRSNKSAELDSLLVKRKAASALPYQIDLIRLQLAIADGDEQAIDGRLDDLASSVGVGEDSDSTEWAQATPPASPNASQRGPAVPPEVIANALLHAALPLHERASELPNVVKIEQHLLRLAAGDKAASDANAMWGWLTRELVRHPAADDQEAAQATQNYFSSIHLKYSNYSGNYGADREKSERSSLAEPAVEAGRWKLAGGFLRPVVRREGNFPSDDVTIPKLAMRLADVSAEQRYELWHRITFGTEGDAEPAFSNNLALYVIPPAQFSSVTASEKQLKAVPVGADDFAVTSTCLMLAEAAAECGRTDDLVSRLSRHVEKPGDEIDAMIGLSLVVSGRVREAGEVLQRVVSVLEQTVPKKNVKSPLPVASALLVARCQSVPELKATAVPAWQSLLVHARRRNIGLPVTFFGRMAAKAGVTPAAHADEGSPLKHWASLQVPFIRKPASQMTEPLYALRDGTLRYAAGHDHTMLMLKYPLAGNYTFSHKCVHHGYSNSHMSYGGTSYLSNTFNQKAKVRALVGRNFVDLPNEAANKHGDNVNALQFMDNRIVMQVNDTPIAIDQRTDSLPFVSLFFLSSLISEVDQIRISGEPTIPRKVEMIGADLRGWACPIIGGLLPKVDLPKSEAERTQATQSRALKDHYWYGAEGELRSGEYTYALTRPRQIQYQRPLLDQETIRYEFFYEPDKQETHPCIGRVVILLRPSGVKLRWQPQSRSLESLETEALNEVDSDERIGNGKPTLEPGKWNQVSLTREGERVLVEVNGEPVCHAPVSIDQRFGVYVEPERAARVRRAELTGPWPQQLPENLLEPK